MSWRPSAGCLALALPLLYPGVAHARTMEVVPYPIAAVWPTSIRFLRVDRGFPIREKDAASGYVLFDFTDGPKPCRASLELIRAADPEGRDATRLSLSIPDLPKHYEQMLIDKLTSKLRDEQGPPAPPPKRSTLGAPTPPDAGE
ncbi:MAG: hypothetical protein ABSB49_04445 [Polyangia bacterium]